MSQPNPSSLSHEIARALEKITPGPWRVSMSGYSVKSNDDDMPIVANNPWGVAMREKDIPRWLENAEFIAQAPDLLRRALEALTQQGWQPIETAPKDGTPFLVTWAPSKMGGRKPCVEMVGGWHEYEECRSYGEPEAYGWHPLPKTLLSPFTVAALPSSGSEGHE